MSKKLTTEEFITRAREVHGDDYDYSKTDLNNRDEKGRVCIICPKHGEFWQSPFSHLKGIKCKQCAYEKLTKDMTKSEKDFIKEVKEKYGNKYDTSKVHYVNAHTKITLVCPIHGDFHIMPYSLLNGKECSKCKHQSYRYTTEEFIKRAKAIHGDKYIYIKTDLDHRDEKGRVCITCPIHGDFWQTPNHHLRGQGCGKCKGKNKTTSEFIEEIKSVFGDLYDLSNVKYVNANTKVCVRCKKHGEFKIKPNDLLNGHGCPLCNSSKLEQKTMSILENDNISFSAQKKFTWLDKQHLDFYLPQYNLIYS